MAAVVVKAWSDWLRTLEDAEYIARLRVEKRVRDAGLVLVDDIEIIKTDRQQGDSLPQFRCQAAVRAVKKS